MKVNFSDFSFDLRTSNAIFKTKRKSPMESRLLSSSIHCTLKITTL